MFRIKELRMKKNISMRQASIELGIPYTTYISYEKGEREPNSEMLKKLSAYFECSIDYLVNNPKEWDKEAQEFADGMYEREQMLLKYLSEYFEDDQEKYIASRIVQFLPMLNIDGLKEAENRIEEMGEIKKYQRFPDLL